MDFGIFGAIDIAIVFLFLIVGFIGYKKGFIKKFLSIVSLVMVLILAFLYCRQVAEFMIRHEIIYPNIYNKVLTTLESKAELEGCLSLADVLNKGMGIPRFIANIWGDVALTDVFVEAAEKISRIVMNVVAFGVIFVGVFIIILILKILADILRSNKVIRFIDGACGFVLYEVMFLIVLYLVFALLRLAYNYEWSSGLNEFLNVDMQLGNDEFRLSKYLFQRNSIVIFFQFFF